MNENSGAVNRAARRARLNGRRNAVPTIQVQLEQRREQRREQERQRHRARRAALTHQRRLLLQQEDAEQHRTAYANLSPEQRTLRQEQDAEQHRTAYANLSPEQRALRQQNTQRRRILRNEQPPLYRAATVPITNEDSVPQHSLGTRDNICSHCGALRWPLEGTRGTLCCSNGKNGNLSEIFQSPFPPFLHDLFTWNITNNEVSPTGLTANTIRNFRQNIRQYNCALQMASSRIQLDKPPSGGMIVAKGAQFIICLDHWYQLETMCQNMHSYTLWTMSQTRLISG